MHRGQEFVARIRSAAWPSVNGPTYGSEPHWPFGGAARLRHGLARGGHRGARRLLRPQDRATSPTTRRGCSAERGRPHPRARRARVRVPGKNVAPLAGHPLLAYSIAAARESGLFDAVVVSTDSRGDRRDRAPLRRRGARAAAGRDGRRDARRTSSGCAHVLAGTDYEVFSILRPTSPFRTAATIRARVGALHGRARRRLAARRAAGARAPGEDVARSTGELMRPLLPQTPGEVPTHSRQTAALPEVLRAGLLAGDRLDADRGRRRDRRPARRAVLLPRASRASRSTTPTTSERAERSPPREPARCRRRGDRLMEAATFAANAPIGCATCRRASSSARAIDDPVRAAAFADACRINALSIDHGGRLGAHRDVVLACWTSSPGCTSRCCDGDDVCFSSKGHDAPAVYAVLAGTGKLDFDAAAPAAPARRAARPPRHRTPCRRCTPTPARSGMGVSKAKGFARAARLQGRPAPRVRHHRRRRAAGGPVLGVARAGGQRGLRRDHASIVDHNKIQSDTWVDAGLATSATSRRRSRAFGWAVARCDGNDVGARAPRRSAGCSSEPRARSCWSPTRSRARACARSSRTTSSARARRCTPYHSGAPAPDVYEAALAELAGRLERAARRPGRAVGAEAPRRVAPADAAAARRRLRRRAGRRPAEREPRLVALDADLYLDCGLIPFREPLPRALRRVRHRRAGHGLPGRRRSRSAACCPPSTRSPASSRRAPTSRSSTTPPRARRSSTPASSPGSSPAARATRTSRCATSR